MAQFKTSSLNYTSVLGNYVDAKFKPIDLSTTSKLADTDENHWYSYLNNLPISDPNNIYYGGYLEKRFFYSNELLFGTGKDKREIHLGVDIWLKTNTPIYAPLDGVVHSIHYNDSNLDYGHTIILKHKVSGREFFSLYGHLSNSHIKSLKANMVINKGESFCTIGGHKENGGWPPHLHLQLILDLGDKKGDYPGVCTSQAIAYFKDNCPDPTALIFNSIELNADN